MEQQRQFTKLNFSETPDPRGQSAPDTPRLAEGAASGFLTEVVADALYEPLGGGAVAALAKGKHILFAPVTGDILINAINNMGEIPITLIYAADRMDLSLFHPANSFTASTLEIDVMTAGAAGTTARIYIYADDGSAGIGAPVATGGPMAQSGNLATDSTGVKTWTPGGGLAFVANTKYWIGVHTSGAPNLATLNTRCAIALTYDKALRQTPVVHRKSATYGSGAPASGVGTKTYANPAMIIMTAS